MSAPVTLDVLAALPELVARLVRRVDDLERELAAAKLAAPTADELLTIAEVASLFDEKVATIHKRVARGSLPSVKKGRARLVRRGDVR